MALRTFISIGKHYYGFFLFFGVCLCIGFWLMPLGIPAQTNPKKEFSFLEDKTPKLNAGSLIIDCNIKGPQPMVEIQLGSSTIMYKLMVEL